MNAIINTFLLAVDKFMPGIDLRQPRFGYNGCGSFTKNKERIKETGDLRYHYQNELACFEDFKDLTRRTTSDKVLHDKAFNIAKNQRRLASMAYKFFDKKNFRRNS